jgi:3-methyladenine DNA glycosylase/8-oxoguanine DNA glycosylase
MTNEQLRLRVEELELELLEVKLEKEVAVMAVRKAAQNRINQAVAAVIVTAEEKIKAAEKRAATAEEVVLRVKEMVAKMKKGGVVVA